MENSLTRETVEAGTDWPTQQDLAEIRQYADLYHKAQLATWEEDDRASSDPTWEEEF